MQVYHENHHSVLLLYSIGVGCYESLAAVFGD